MIAVETKHLQYPFSGKIDLTSHGNRVSQAMVERNGADDARIQSPRLCFHFGCE